MRRRCAPSVICWKSTILARSSSRRWAGHLQARGMKVSNGTIVDATIINAPSSTKLASGERGQYARQQHAAGAAARTRNACHASSTHHQPCAPPSPCARRACHLRRPSSTVATSGGVVRPESGKRLAQSPVGQQKGAAFAPDCCFPVEFTLVAIIGGHLNSELL